jgi:hypothetical protein
VRPEAAKGSHAKCRQRLDSESRRPGSVSTRALPRSPLLKVMAVPVRSGSRVVCMHACARGVTVWVGGRILGFELLVPAWYTVGRLEVTGLPVRSVPSVPLPSVPPSLPYPYNVQGGGGVQMGYRGGVMVGPAW